jgi:hypothetical protein
VGGVGGVSGVGGVDSAGGVDGEGGATTEHSGGTRDADVVPIPRGDENGGDGINEGNGTRRPGGIRSHLGRPCLRHCPKCRAESDATYRMSSG